MSLKLDFFSSKLKNLIIHTFVYARAQFPYTNSHLHNLRNSVVRAVENINYIDPKMKEASERLKEWHQ